MIYFSVLTLKLYSRALVQKMEILNYFKGIWQYGEDLRIRYQIICLGCSTTTPNIIRSLCNLFTQGSMVPYLEEP